MGSLLRIGLASALAAAFSVGASSVAMACESEKTGWIVGKIKPRLYEAAELTHDESGYYPSPEYPHFVLSTKRKLGKGWFWLCVLPATRTITLKNQDGFDEEAVVYTVDEKAHHPMDDAK